MDILWKKHPASVLELLEAVNLGRDEPVTRNTLQTQLTRLETKGWIVRDDSSRSHVYEPAVPEQRGRTSVLTELKQQLLRRQRPRTRPLPRRERRHHRGGAGGAAQARPRPERRSRVMSTRPSPSSISWFTASSSALRRGCWCVSSFAMPCADASSPISVLMCLYSPFDISMRDLFPTTQHVPVFTPIRETFEQDWRVKVEPQK